MKIKSILLISVLFSSIYPATEGLGENLPLYSILPFLGILLSIAIIPLLAPIFWHHNFGKISAFWALSLVIPSLFLLGLHETLHQLLHVFLLEYLPFIILLLSLFTISGGIQLKGSLIGTPLINSLLIFIGTALASWMGTTGAAMLLIRPILRANKYRHYNVHTVIFFIILVANIGGSLTPLGDPPLFLGFLNGIDFFWTTKIMFLPMFCASFMLLIAYFIVDSYFYKKEKHIVTKLAYEEKIAVDGKINIILILGVIISVLLSGFWKPDFSIPEIFGIQLEFQNITRDILLLILAILSWVYTSDRIRDENGYTWFPILEVSKLFAGIFITIIPAIIILKAGTKGKLNFLIEMLNTSDGQPINTMYFWLTGLLSSILDNAPTYLVFFNIAGINDSNIPIADYLMHVIPDTLFAISMGAVFMGALTYIGNAPNFMVKSIAEENNISMPSFFGYLFWSLIILIPIFIIINIIFL